MKKMMVCLAAVGLAVGVQAATYNWKTSANAQGLDATAVTGNGDYAAGSVNMKNNGSWTAVLALYDTATGDLVGQSAATALKYSTAGSKVNNTALVVSEAVAGTTYDYVLTITGYQNSLRSRGEDSAAGYDYSAAVMTETLSGSIATAAAGATTLSTEVPSEWEVTGITALTPVTPDPDPSGVPEPTSGLLMLVGLGALALRRRR